MADLIRDQKAGKMSETEVAAAAKKYFEWLEPKLEQITPFRSGIEKKLEELATQAVKAGTEKEKAELMSEAAEYWGLLQIGVAENIQTQEDADVFLNFGGPAARTALAFMAATMGVRAIGYAEPAMDIRITSHEVRVADQGEMIEMPEFKVVSETPEMPETTKAASDQKLQEKRDYARHYEFERQQFAEQEVNRSVDKIVDQIISFANEHGASPMDVDFENGLAVEFSASFDGSEAKNRALCEDLEKGMMPLITQALADRGFDTVAVRSMAVGERIRIPDGRGGHENLTQSEAENRLIKLLNVSSVDDVYKLIRVYNRTPEKLTPEQRQQLDIYIGNNRVPTISYVLKVNIPPVEGESVLPETPEPKTEIKSQVEIIETVGRTSRLVELVADERRYVQPIFEDDYVVQMYDPEFGEEILPPGEKLKYSCVGGVCYLDLKGNFITFEECQQNCTVPPLPPEGEGNDGEGMKYSCVNGKCIPSLYGEYSSYEQCMQFCRIQPPPPPEEQIRFAGQKGPNIQRMHREGRRDEDYEDVAASSKKDTGRGIVRTDEYGEDIQKPVRTKRIITPERIDQEAVTARKYSRGKAQDRRAEQRFKDVSRQRQKELFDNDEVSE